MIPGDSCWQTMVHSTMLFGWASMVLWWLPKFNDFEARRLLALLKPVPYFICTSLASVKLGIEYKSEGEGAVLPRYLIPRARLSSVGLERERKRTIGRESCQWHLSRMRV